MVSEQQTEEDVFAPIKNFFAGLTGGSPETAQVQRSKLENDYDEPIAAAKEILNIAANTKTEDPDLVVDALMDLETLMRWVYGLYLTYLFLF